MRQTAEDITAARGEEAGSEQGSLQKAEAGGISGRQEVYVPGDGLHFSPRTWVTQVTPLLGSDLPLSAGFSMTLVESLLCLSSPGETEAGSAEEQPAKG